MSYRNKTYVSFDADTDMKYYNLFRAWGAHENINFVFSNAHEINTLRAGSSEDTIKRKLRERLNNTKVMIVLVGENTRYLYKYVRWEIEYAIEYNIPIIVVNLNGMRVMDYDRCPAILRGKLAMHVSFNKEIIKTALEDWPYQHFNIPQDQITDYHYLQETYTGLGL